MPNDNMLTDTKLIIVDNFDEYIDELEDCAKQAGIPDVFVCDNVSDLEKELRKTPMDILILLSVSDGLEDFGKIVYCIEKEEVMSCSIFVMDMQDKTGIQLVDNHNGQWMDASSTYGEDTMNALLSIRDDIIAREEEEARLETQQSDYQDYPSQPVQQNGYQQPQSQGQGRDAFTIMLASPKGGTGKSTLAMEVAYGLTTDKNKRICLFDLNPSFDTLSSTIGCVQRTKNYKTIYDCIHTLQQRCFNLMTPEERREVRQERSEDYLPYLEKYNVELTREDIQELLIKDPKTGQKNKRESGLWILPTIALPFDYEYVSREYVRQIIRTLKQYFDYIVIDTADNVSYSTVEGYQESDRIFLVTNHTIAATSVIAKMMTQLDHIGVSRDQFDLIVNSPNGNHYDKTPETFSSVLKIPLLAVIPFDEKMQKAHGRQRPYAIYNPKSKFARALATVLNQIKMDAYDKKKGRF